MSESKLKKPKFTPGPWHVDKSHLWSSDGKVILVLSEPEKGEEGEANAKLIAASPDLLYACQALKEAYDLGEESGGVDWSDLDQAYKLAVDALKKAGLA